MVPGHLGVVLVGLAIALLPVGVLARTQVEPPQELPRRQLRLRTPGGDEVDHGIARVVGNPRASQGSPTSSFSFMNSSVTLAMTRSFRSRRCRSSPTVRSRARCSAVVSLVKAAAPFSKNCFCQV